MNAKEIIQREIEAVRKMISDETWLEGERRHCPVQHRDPIVQGRVADILLNGVGAELRKGLEASDQR
jgi:hypothetical protein